MLPARLLRRFGGENMTRATGAMFWTLRPRLPCQRLRRCRTWFLLATTRTGIKSVSQCSLTRIKRNIVSTVPRNSRSRSEGVTYINLHAYLGNHIPRGRPQSSDSMIISRGTSQESLKPNRSRPMKKMIMASLAATSTSSDQTASLTSMHTVDTSCRTRR